MHIHEVTVIVPTKNEVHNIPFLIRSIPPDVNLILVDASDDDTPNLCLRLRPQHTKVIRSKARIAAARNLGAQAATTSWLIFTDADVTFAPDYFKRLAQIERSDAIYGSKLSQDDQASYYRRFVSWQKRFNRIGIPAVSGSNLLIKADVFHKVGEFNPDLLVNEDTELGYRLKKQEYQVEFESALVVYARDHRRLVRGKLRKDLHTLARCTLIYLNVFPSLWTRRDWGYWSK